MVAQVRECIPFIRGMEKELEKSRREALRVITKTECLERELSTLKEVGGRWLLGWVWSGGVMVGG